MDSIVVARLQSALAEMVGRLSSVPDRVEVYGSPNLVSLLLEESDLLGVGTEALAPSESWRVDVLPQSEVLVTMMREWDLPDDLLTGEMVGESCDLFQVRFPPPGLTHGEEEVYVCLRDSGLPPQEAREAAALVVR